MSNKLASLMLVALVSAAGRASAETYKTADGSVVVTGLKPAVRYQIRMLDAQGKPGSRQDKSVNTCGEIVVEKAAAYQKLNIGDIAIEPAALPVQEHARCKPPAPPARMQPKGVEKAETPHPN